MGLKATYKSDASIEDRDEMIPRSTANHVSALIFYHNGIFLPQFPLF